MKRHNSQGVGDHYQTGQINRRHSSQMSPAALCWEIWIEHSQKSFSSTIWNQVWKLLAIGFWFLASMCSAGSSAAAFRFQDLSGDMTFWFFSVNHLVYMNLSCNLLSVS